MIAKIAGRVRGLFAGNYPENKEDEQLVINNRGDLSVAQGLPELVEVVRLGNSWQTASTTGQAALTALPTTTAGLSLANGEPASGACYAIDSVAIWEAVADATQSDQTALFAMLNKQGSAAPSAGTQETGITSLSGRLNYAGNAVVRRGATVVNDGWFPCGTSAPSGVTAVAGAIWKVTDVPIRGLYLVRPGSAFSVQAVKVAGAASQMFFCIRHHEVQVLWKT